MANEPHNLQDGDTARRFYDDRYDGDYMAEWPAAKLSRVRAFVRELDLPARGMVLDYGCGAGVFTGVLQEALPGWQVYGADISSRAIEKATMRLPGCTFLAADRLPGNFDLVFTHHVLEHVSDLRATLGQLSSLARPGSAAVHILPCGDEGSLEWRLCQLRLNGVDPAQGGRFFYEEEGHLRRLTSRGFADEMKPFGYDVTCARYANHFWGAVQWLSSLDKAAFRALFDESAAADPSAATELRRNRRRFGIIRALRRPPSLIRAGAEWRMVKLRKDWRDWAILLAGNPLSALAPAVAWTLHRLEEREWRRKQRHIGGSEMYLFFRRNGG